MEHAGVFEKLVSPGRKQYVVCDDDGREVARTDTQAEADFRLRRLGAIKEVQHRLLTALDGAWQEAARQWASVLAPEDWGSLESLAKHFIAVLAARKADPNFWPKSGEEEGRTAPDR